MRGRIDNQGARLSHPKYPIYALGGKRGKTQAPLYSYLPTPWFSRGIVKEGVLIVCGLILPFLPSAMRWFPQQPCGNGLRFLGCKTTPKRNAGLIVWRESSKTVLKNRRQSGIAPTASPKGSGGMSI
jgi:hypothetical protein